MMFPKTLFFLAILTLMIFHQNNLAQTPPLETGISQSLAKWRSANYSDVRYKLNLTLEKGAPLMKGDIEIRVNLTEEGAKNDLILDWRMTQFANDKDKPFANVTAVNEMTGAQAARLPEREARTINIKYSNADGSYAAFSDVASEPLALQSNEHLIIPKTLLKKGENFIKIEFASPIKTSGAAVTRYVDKEDGAEYIYSLFVPSDASTAFPVFDQPDLKARFQLKLYIPTDWKAVSNTEGKSFVENYNGSFGVKTYFSTEFAETKPISTYVFAFAAGDFAEVSEPTAVVKALKRQSGNSVKFRPSGSDFAKLQPPTTASGSDLPKDDDLPMKIYVRKSQVEKFGQHITEVFRLNREGVKFLEDWFDYKFPFPKYDLVLIPEFPFGGMEHAGATFLREDRIIFPTEPTKNDYITRANVIFHEAAHQWFGDTVTMKWFDDLWLKEGFAEFMAYKTLAKVMPEYNAWKVFYERNKQAAYLTDVTRGTTPIYQEIPNLSAAKSAYGNIVYRKAPSFLRQAEFYLGEDKFQTAVRAFLKKHEFANAEWTDLVKEFELAPGGNNNVSKRLDSWAKYWVTKPGLTIVHTFTGRDAPGFKGENPISDDLQFVQYQTSQSIQTSDSAMPFALKFKLLAIFEDGSKEVRTTTIPASSNMNTEYLHVKSKVKFAFPNYQDYGYGIFLLDEKSRAFVLENIQNEKDDFLRSMMWGSLWDSLRFYELAPEDYVKLVIKNINAETDESTIQSLLGRVSTAMNYYIASAGSAQSEPPAVAGGLTRQGQTSNKNPNAANAKLKPSATADGSDLQAALEKLLINKIETASSVGQKITYFRALQSIGSGEQTKQIFKDLLTGKSKLKDVELKTKDKFDLVTRLIILGDKDALNLLADLEKTETDDAAKRYAYAARAGIPTAENKSKYWRDFTENKEISESWIESAFGVWNSPRHADLTLLYLEKALAELPNLKKNRKIFFVNGWLSSFIGGQKSEAALNIVNKFLADNPDLDKDLRLKILENSDNLERAVKIRTKYGKE